MDSRARAALDLHEDVHRISDEASGLKAVIAIHSTALGPALGGCHVGWSVTKPDGIAAALRLSEAASYRHALAGLPHGGAAAVLEAPANAGDHASQLESFGRAVNHLHGSFIAAPDAGLSPQDMRMLRSTTRHVAGLPRYHDTNRVDPSGWTALGLFLAMEVAVGLRLQRGLSEVTVAVQGLGNVGLELCRLLHEAGAGLIVADYRYERARRAALVYGATALDPDRLMRVDADVFAPCATGGVLREATIATLAAPVVVGSAANQLAAVGDADRLARRGVFYAPDFLVNAGGAIALAGELLGRSASEIETDVRAIPERLVRITRCADTLGTTPDQIARQLARERLAQARSGKAMAGTATARAA